MGNSEAKHEIWVKIDYISNYEVEISGISKMFKFYLPSDIINLIDILFHSMVENSGNTQEIVPEITEISLAIRHMKKAFKELKVRDGRGNLIY